MIHEIDPHHPHDAIAQEAFRDRERVIAFLNEYLPKKIRKLLNFQELKILERSFFSDTMKEFEVDFLYVIPFKNSPKVLNLFILFEHQKEPDFLMPLRLLRYIMLVTNYIASLSKGDEIPIVYPIVFFQGGNSKWTVPMHYSELLNIPEELKAELLPFIPDFTYQLIDLQSLSDDEIRGPKDIQALLLIMRAAALKGKKALIALEKASKVYSDTLGDPKTEHFGLKLLQYLLYTVDEDDQLVVDTLLKDDPRRKEFTMTPYLRKLENAWNEGLTIGRQEGRQEGALEGLLKGRQEGRQEGTLEGLRQGQQRALVEGIMEILEERFGFVSSKITLNLNEVHDLSQLKQLLKKAALTPSLDEFTKALHGSAS